MVKLKNTASIFLFLILATFYPVDTRLVYPAVKRNETEVEVHFGKEVPNPYKWLTNASDTENEQFMEEQTNLTNTYLANLSSGERKIITKYMKLYEPARHMYFETIVKAGDKYFFLETYKSTLFLQKNEKDKPSIVLSTDPNEPPFDMLIAAMASPVGDTIAHSFCSSLDLHPMQRFTYQFRNVATGKDLSDILYNVSTLVRYDGDLIQWNIDGSGIFYLSNTSTPSAANAEATKDQKMYIFYHAIGTKQTEDILLAELPAKSIWGLTLTEDGQYLVAVYDAKKEAMLNRYYRRKENTKKMGMGSIYYLELYAKGKAPCKPTKDTKPNVTKIDILEHQYQFIGSKDNQFYILHSSDSDEPFDRIIQLDLAKPTQKDWKTIISVNSSEERISYAGVVNSEFLLVVYWSHLSHTSKMDVHKLSSIGVAKKVPIQYGRILGMSIGRNKTKVVYHMETIMRHQEAYVVDLATLSLEKILLPGYPDDSYRDEIVTTETKYTVNQGGDQMPIIIMHGKNFKKDGKSPALMLLEGEYFTKEEIHKLLVPFMETFNGAVALARIALSPEYSYLPNNVMIQSTEAAIEFLFKEKYTDKAHLTLAPGYVEFSSLLAAIINHQPNTCGAALFVDSNFPALGYLSSGRSKKYAELSHRNLDLTPYFKDKASTEEYLKVSPLHNVKASTSKQIQYPAIFLIDVGSNDEKRYISELQHQIGQSAHQVNPLLAKFPVPRSNSSDPTVNHEVEQYVEVFSFLVLSLNYTVTK